MQHQTQYWLTCPRCRHQMEVRGEGGPLRAKYCDKCNLLFSFTNEELAVAENIGTGEASFGVSRRKAYSVRVGA